MEVNTLIDSMLLVKDGKYIHTCNLVVFLYQGLYILTEINPWYETCRHINTDVYIGMDSLRLAENIVFKKGSTALDLCSGTGIQGMLAAKSAKKVVSVEINTKAAPVTQFNIMLNGLEDIIELRVGDLYSVLKDEKFDYIYANPPFIPMLEDEGINYPICGAGGEDGTKILKNIIDGAPKYLNENGKIIIFCQCLGDENEIFFNKKLEIMGSQFNWNVNAAILDRVALRYHVQKLCDLTKLFNEEFDEDKFKNRMWKIYKGLSAKYLYSIVYDITSNCMEHSNYYLELYNKWDIDNIPEIVSEVSFEQDNHSFRVKVQNDYIGYFDNEALEIYEEVKKGISIHDIAVNIFHKHQNDENYLVKYPGFSIGKCECIVLNSCMEMEQLGVIKSRVQ